MNTNKPRTAIICISLFSICVVTLAGCNADQGNGVAANYKTSPTSTNGQSTTASQPDAKDQVQIVIQNFAFAPSEITVEPGTKVTWVNKDDAPHTATSVDNKFNSGGLDTNDTYSFVFKDKGDYQYYCTLHPQMKAIIKVK